MKIFFKTLLTLFLYTTLLFSQRPIIGVQIWIEPGQTNEQIDGWFKQLKEKNLPLTRLFIMWNQIEKKSGEWDFSQYDQAFKSAEKYGVKIVATLTADFGPPHKGYVYMFQGSAGSFDTQEQQNYGAEYIEKVVNRYKNSPALDTWMLANEPSYGGNGTSFSMQYFKEYLKTKYVTIDKLNESWLTNYTDFSKITYDATWSSGRGAWLTPTIFVDWRNFCMKHLHGYLTWISTEIKKYDTKHPLHVNPAGILQGLPARGYDMPSYRSFLDSFGASVHPAHQFGLLDQDQFAMGVSYHCDLIAGSAEPKPFWVTELQGGNNLVSARRPLYPTTEELSQWVWTSFGAGADRIIFWLLNARRLGYEAAEWSMLDFLNRPSERLNVVSDISNVISANKEFFNKAKPIKPNVTIMLSLSTMIIQERYTRGEIPARNANAHLIEALSFYETLNELGINSRLKHIHDFDWKKEAKDGGLVILPHINALSKEEAEAIELYVKNGGNVLITGQTGLYNHTFAAWPIIDKFPLANICGGELKDIRVASPSLKPTGPEAITPVNWSDVYNVPILFNNNKTIPANFWIGEIENKKAEVIATYKSQIAGTKNKYFKGSAIWIPSLIGIAAWQQSNKNNFVEWLKETTAQYKDKDFGFTNWNSKCLLRVLKHEKSSVTVITNGILENQKVKLYAPKEKTPTILWGQKPNKINDNVWEIEMTPKATSVIMWK